MHGLTVCMVRTSLFLVFFSTDLNFFIFCICLIHQSLSDQAYCFITHSLIRSIDWSLTLWSGLLIHHSLSDQVYWLITHSDQAYWSITLIRPIDPWSITHSLIRSILSSLLLSSEAKSGESNPLVPEQQNCLSLGHMYTYCKPVVLNLGVGTPSGVAKHFLGVAKLSCCPVHQHIRLWHAV